MILALAIVALLAVIGCAQPDGGAADVMLPASAPPDNVTWISPGKVNVSNFYPGARAEYPLTIHNGNDYFCSFEVGYRYPDHVGEGYSMPPGEAQDWVMVIDPSPVLAPYETKDILITLEIPEGAVVSEQSWEFWVSVVDMSQTGTVRTELCCRWLISMRN